MAMTRPYYFDICFQDGSVSDHSTGLQDDAALRVGCCTVWSIICGARFDLQDARNPYNEYKMNVQTTFNLATIKSAEAVDMSSETRRIAESYMADMVIFNALSPSMIGAAQHDPIAEIILHSSLAVIVKGLVRKEISVKATVGNNPLDWASISKKVVPSSEKMQKEIDKIDF
ncbi:hypothetical protein G6011_02129 [Alternaria panax]|uniref:Uncharacterized protein n=1 Tax=Alternaria panax TaxID=48097 RepID=A0AAD4FGB3_9PLEO|nr:hypothetical protein G6011_02129 [Alternaria panax]